MITHITFSNFQPTDRLELQTIPFLQPVLNGNLNGMFSPKFLLLSTGQDWQNLFLREP